MANDGRKGRKPDPSSNDAGGRHAEDRSARHKKAAFLSAFAETCNISAACKAAEMPRSLFYRWSKDPAFDAEFDEAKERAVEAMELEARRRAMHGLVKVKIHEGGVVLVPVDKHGNVVAPDSKEKVGMAPLIEREYSDTLMIFLLKSHKPETYRERFEITTKADPIQACESMAEAAGAARAAVAAARAGKK
jgi:hypothetical protein